MFSQKAEKFGLPAPKGILLLGPPGTGKSLTAKIVSNYWRLPLLKLDFGKIFSGLVGSSEENMRLALKTAEGLSPSVLWVDEIEKGLAEENLALVMVGRRQEFLDPSYLDARKKLNGICYCNR